MRKNYTTKGSITVFLSMTLLIIISLVMTTLEALRAYNMSVYTQRALYTALDSVLAEYYYPLFKEYHVFGLDGGYGSNTINDGLIQDKVSEYMEYTFKPSKNISFAGYNIPINSFNIYNINTESVQVETVHTLMDYGGDMFRNQAIDYTKYRIAGEGIETLLEKVNLIDDAKLNDMVMSQTILEEKLNAEKEISLITDDLIELSKLLDGVVITSKGPKTNKDGSLYINDSFIKKICNSNTTINNPYPSNPWVSKSLKGRYINPKEIINTTINYLDLLIENNKTRDKADTKKVIEDCNKKEEKLMSDFRASLSNIKNLVTSTDNLTKTALLTLKRIDKNQVKITNAINKYETRLTSMKNDIGDSLYSSILDDFKELEKYKSNNNNNTFYDFIKMKSTLEENQRILNNIKNEFNITISTNEKTWSQGKQKLIKIRNLISKYSHDGLQLDYSLQTDTIEEMDFFGPIVGLAKDGLLELVLPDSKGLSDKNIGNIKVSSLPSSISKNKEKASGDISKNLIGLSLSNSFTIFSNMVKDFTESFTANNLLINSLDAIGGTILYQKYLFDHFATLKTDSKVEMPLSLDYEIEYLIEGKASDLDNIKSVVSKLITFRTITNTISLLTNKTSNKQANLIATSLVGFLGIPVLITITKTIILFIWGLSESLVDVSAILRDKSVAIYKGLKDFQMDINELPYLNKKLIEQKVDKVKSKKSSFYLDYEDHLEIFLFIKNKKVKTYRALDLIQINLQNNYEDSFLISNCIFSINVKADFSMDQKFLNFPFVKDSISNINEGYIHSIKLENAY